MSWRIIKEETVPSQKEITARRITKVVINISLDPKTGEEFYDVTALQADVVTLGDDLATAKVTGEVEAPSVQIPHDTFVGGKDFAVLMAALADAVITREEEIKQAMIDKKKAEDDAAAEADILAEGT